MMNVNVSTEDRGVVCTAHCTECSRDAELLIPFNDLRLRARESTGIDGAWYHTQLGNAVVDSGCAHWPKNDAKGTLMMELENKIRSCLKM